MASRQWPAWHLYRFLWEVMVCSCPHCSQNFVAISVVAVAVVVAVVAVAAAAAVDHMAFWGYRENSGKHSLDAYCFSLGY